MERLAITQVLHPSKKQLELIKRQIADRGLTQMALSAETGIDQGYLSKILAGKAPITEPNLRALAKAVGLRVMARLELDIYR